MHKPAPVHSGPTLKRRRVARHRRKVAIMQPVEHSVLLLDAGPALIGAVARGRGAPGLVAQRGVVLDEARAHEQNVAGTHVAALRGGADVEPLRGGAGAQVRQADGVRRVGVVGDAVAARIVPVVEEHGAAGDAVRGPVVDAVAVVGVRAFDVGFFHLPPARSWSV